MPNTAHAPKAFLSHNSQDKHVVEIIRGMLESGDTALGEPPIPCWYDKDELTSKGPEGCVTWMSQLEHGLLSCEAAVIFFGPHGLGPVQRPEKELLLKRSMYKCGEDALRLAVVLLPGARFEDVIGFISLWMWADFRSGPDDALALQRLRAFIQGKAPSSGPGDDPLVPKPPIEPYRGLQAFDGHHANYFFGRDEEIKKLCERLNEWPVTTVIGGSGSGKSSLVRAGLQTEVARRERPVLRDRTTIITVRPGCDPIYELAVQVAQTRSQKSAQELEKEFLKREDGLYRELIDLFPSDEQHILLVIDQLEELFTHIKTEELTQNQPAQSGNSGNSRQEHFIALLAAVSNSERRRLRIVITVRADFFDRCLSIPMLHRIVENKTLLLGQLSAEGLRDVIERPIRVVGATFEKGVVERIIKDVENQNGSLPLLQHALTELWARRKFGFLTDDAYTDIGGVEGALKKRADITLASLNPEQREIARHIFLRLTTLGEGVCDTRRRVRKAELYPEESDQGAIDSVLRTLSSDSSRLIVMGKDVTSGNTTLPEQVTVEVTHEALIQRWSTLTNWLNENRDNKRLHDRLRDAADEWSRATEAHRPSYLWDGGRLEIAEQFDRSYSKQCTEVERSFLRESILKREVAKREELKRLHKTRRLLHWVSCAAITALIALCFAITFAYQANYAERNAVTERAIAVKQKEMAEHTLYTSKIQSAVHAWELGDFENARQILNDAQWNLRGWEHNYLFDKVTRQSIATLRGHSHIVSSVCFSPDGTRIVSGSLDGTVKVWDAETWKDITTFKDAGAVFSVCFSPDGRRIVSGGEKTLKIWDAETGKETLTLWGHTDYVRYVCFSPDGTRIVSGSDDNTLKVWNAENGQQIIAFDAHSNAVSAVCFSPDGTRIVSGSDDKTLKVWNAENGKQILALDAHSDSVSCVSFSPDGKRIASGSDDKTLKVWNAENGQQILALKSLHAVRSASFSPDGERIVSSNDTTLKVWDAKMVQEVRSLARHAGPVFSVCFSPDGRRIISGSDDRTVQVWDADTGANLLNLEGHSDRVLSVCCSPDQKLIVSGSDDNTLKVWDAKTGQQIHVLKGHTDGVDSVSFSPDGKRIVSGSFDRTLKLWDSETGVEILTVKDAAYAGGVSFSPDGKWIVSGSSSGLGVWDSETGHGFIQRSGTYYENWGDQVIVFCFSPDGKWIVCGNGKNTLKVWEVETWKEILTLDGHADVVWSACFSPDCKRIVSGSSDKTLKVWDAVTGQEILTLSGHTAGVFSVNFSPDGARIISGSNDKTLKMLAGGIGQEILLLRGHYEPVSSVCFSSDGKRIISRSSDSMLKVWDATTGLPLKMQREDEELLRMTDTHQLSRTLDREVLGERQRLIIRGIARNSGQGALLFSGWDNDGDVLSPCFSPDGRKVVTGCSDGSVKVWLQAGQSAPKDAIGNAEP